MKLTDGEKLIIALLADLKSGADEIDSERVMSAIARGNLWSLRWDHGSLFDADEEPSQDVIDETFKILSMWERIEDSFDTLTEADKVRVREENVGADPKFSGFDGNNEQHFPVANCIVSELKRFPKFKDRDLNSHATSVPQYLRMLAELDRIYGNAQFAAELSADELITVLKARKHPE